MVDGDPGAVPAGIDLTAFRIVQEALTNTLRHAPGSQACVRISYFGGAVTVQVSDSGQPDGDGRARGAADSAADGAADGPDGERALDGTGLGTGLGPGYGLAGIAERVASCGGSLTVGPDPAGGFAVTARLPVR
jgi:signal transduction histidine kinase